MKIGILTFHKPINYGAYLQAFSLSETLSECFPDDTVEIIDYIAPREKNKIILNVLWGIKHYGIMNGLRDIQKIKSFHRVYPALALSPRLKAANLEDVFAFIDRSYDILVIGSDAVFNWNQNGYPTAFLPLYDFKHCKVVSCAASVHGLRYLEEPINRLKECAAVLNKMVLVGVRDRNTEKFVKTCSKEIQVMHCCDPTCVIDVQKIRDFAKNCSARILKKYRCNLKEKYIVFMMPDCLLTKMLREKYAKEYKIITVFKPARDADFYLHDLNPFEWAAVLSGASAVVTSYFHGTLLALKQNVPVISIDFSNYNDENYEGKLKDLLLTRLNLPDFYYDGRYIDNKKAQEKILHVLDDALAGKYHLEMEENMRQEADSFWNFVEEFRAKRYL